MRAQLALVITLFVSSLHAATAIFPSPLHITRQVHDPISGKTTVLNEYGYGNRLISVRGSQTAIADYEKGELTEIDREAGTYSVTKFETLAKLADAIGVPDTSVSSKSTPRLRTVPAATTKSGRNAEFFATDVEASGIKQTFTVAIDRSVRLSKAALEVLSGSAYPGVRRPEHEAMFIAAAPAGRPRIASQANDASADDGYGLPIEQTIEYEIEGQKLEFRSSVLRVDNDPPSADVLSIPAGARLVESRTSAVNRELELTGRGGVPARKTP